MSWKNYIRSFRTYLLLERSLAENSIEAYERDVNKLIEFMEMQFPKVKPEAMELQHAQAFVQYIHTLGMSAKSQSRIISGIRAFYKYLLLEDIVKVNPTELLELPKLAKKLPDTISKEEIDLLVDAIDMSGPQAQRNKAILETLYSCGLRVSELTNMLLSNIYWKEGFIRVIGKGDKERLIPIGDEALKYIRIYLDTERLHIPVVEGHQDFLFLNRRGKQLTRVMIFTIIKRLTETAGLKKNISPHTFRHSFASDLVNAGADLRAVQEMLGHESITTTEIYTHLDRDYLRETITSYHPRYR